MRMTLVLLYFMEFLEVNRKKPLEKEHITNIVFLFAGNRVAANLSVLNGCEIPLLEKEGKTEVR